MITIVSRLVVLLLAFAVNGCSATECPSHQQGVRCFEVVTNDGNQFKGIVFKRLKLDGRYVTRFRRRDGFEIVSRSGRQLRSIESDNFVAALEQLIIRAQRRGEKIDEIQLDFDVVGDAWDDIRSAIRKAVKTGRGPLRTKDPTVTQALRQSIRQSKLVRLTCEMVRRHGMACSPQNSFTEQVAFQREYLADRSKIAAADDVGLSKDLWISISFVVVEKDERD
jgi:hypothetical protein